ncbi:pirin family protein [Rubellimicrobium aerolatum]|uniref:Pirin family protein n=1 Tax=Rubellimicrobium aerolatum TaxID=490979 RepID=A0ABW0SFI7_9RHOB|nr:pirin family protein [Rubellimicrobium aerolatum]MBP1806906.1 redox-sensitive bicupin YhaK (pirin superfamily) [Rubellimicrobium aerolatum]
MFRKLGRSPAVIDQGQFVVRVAMPGLALPEGDDHGHGPLAAVAESFMAPGTLIGMHPHVQDEIISWVPEGVMRHDDRTHGRLVTDAGHLLVMNAGREFWHEERTLPSDPPLRMLQIFVRPHEVDLEPMLQHGPLPDPTPNAWRLLVGPEGTDSPFVVRNDVYLHDLRLDAGQSVALPSRPGWSTYAYVYSGAVEAEGERLGEAESALVTAPVDVTIRAVEPSVLVAFVLNPAATVTREGSIGDRATRRLYQAVRRPVVP